MQPGLPEAPIREQAILLSESIDERDHVTDDECR